MTAAATPPTRLWHPFAAMGKVDGHELVLTRGEGCRLWDADGNEYLDATAGLWFANVGHGRAEIADAVADQLRVLASHHVFGDHANEPALALAARVADTLTAPRRRRLLRPGGGEAIDTAAKIARRYWALLGQTQRTVVISRRFAYHGTNAYGTSLSGIPASATATARSSATSPRWSTTTRPTSPASSTSSAAAQPHSSASR